MRRNANNGKMSEEGCLDGLNWVPSEVLKFSTNSMNEELKKASSLYLIWVGINYK